MAMGSSLASLYSMEIDYQNCHLELMHQDVYVIWSMLAKACHSLVSLKLRGNFQYLAVKSFGDNCPSLAHLHISPDHICLLSNLQGALPTLCCLTFLTEQEVSSVSHANNHERLKRALTALKECKIIKNLCLGRRGSMDEEMWGSLPPNLQMLIVQTENEPVMSVDRYNRYNRSLRSDREHDGPADGLKLPNLISVKFDCRIQELGALLRAAPNLEFIDTTVGVRCEESCDFYTLPAWGLLCSRLQGTLRCVLSMRLYEGCPGRTFHEFLCKVEPVPQVANIGFLSDRCVEDWESGLEMVASRFPQLEGVTLLNLATSDESLHSLAGCTHLKCVCLISCWEVTNCGLLMMATQMCSLKELWLCQCPRVDWRAQRIIKSLLVKYEIPVSVLGFG